MNPTWTSPRGDVQLYLGDCLKVLPTLPKVDAVITDPPYSSGGMVRGDRMATADAAPLLTGATA
jgi:site-specific DNA-methyltransferase (adenine-specific)